MANRQLVALSTLLLVISGALFFGSGDAQQPKPMSPQPNPSQGVPAKLEQPKQQPPGGRVVELPSDRLPRFKQPVPNPPKHHPHPPQRPGGNWHWHPSRGHIWLPGPVVSPTFVLPPTYQLPPLVYYYERQQSSYVICPHCNQKIVWE